MLNARKIRLRDIFPGYQKFTYLYDFGDSWHHIITLKQIALGTSKHATLTAGKGACPPEDCGGYWGYEDLKKKMTAPKDPENEELRVWMGQEEGEKWDPEAFDLEGVQEVVRGVR